ncbi:unnamed protein product [Arabidopsis arenosa]|uniref:Mutator-like transposase n=1 Tax=Arabidopsis arenosa TaxID=38785 RepID=A0A8S2AUG6_ARAAE|nr:unnamed protein product [Arabidopsis arenosa]
MSFDLFIHAGGYWSTDDQYLGGEPHSVGLVSGETFKLSSVQMLLVEHLGYEDNMKRVSWFPPETPDEKEDLDNDDVLKRVVHYAIGSGALTLYAVREDDPYIGRHIDSNAIRYLSEDDNERVLADGEDVGGSGSESDSGGDENQFEDLVHSSSDDDNPHVEVDESKYRKFCIGDKYNTIDSFKSAINRYAVKKRRDIKYEKSDSKRVVAICSGKKCPWRISATINSTCNRVVIRSLQEEHNCTWQGKVSLLTNSRIADLYIEEFRLNPDFSAEQLQQKLLRRNINVPWTICERTRLKCLKTFDEEQEESFARLFDYVAELKRSNIGSTVECEVRETRFHRFYVCFAALKNGWKRACRKILHLDGTFLKWRMTGMLLVACGRDPNDQMFPVAWGIVDCENTPNWLWFLEHLVDDLGLDSGNGLTLGSDQQKGLIAAVKVVLPFAEHRMCARHVYSNWKKNYAGADYEDMFWAAADSYYPQQFDRKMQEIKEYNEAAYNALKISVFCPWSRAFFTEFSKCAAVENNLGESFNAAIRVVRTKPIVEMLEEIRKRVMVSNDKKRSEAEKTKGDYTPKSIALLDQQIDLAKNCRPLSCGLGNYEVGYFNYKTNMRIEGFVVQMRGDIKCSCRIYMISGIPCSHIVSCLRHEKNTDQDPKKMISPWFTTQKLKTCYADGLCGVNGMNLWEVTTNVRVMPPKYKRPGGRPPGKKRKREKGEPREGTKLSKRGTKIHCGTCGKEGHNKSNCKNAPMPKLPKKPPGRPRKIPSAKTPFASAPTSVPGSSSQPIEDLPRISSAPTSVLGSTSQPIEDLPSLSSALPKRRRGRPRKQPDGASSSQPAPQRQEPVYDTGPMYLPREGYGVFTSPLTGDDYIHVGRSVTDTRDNTVLPSSLYRAREHKKMAIARGRGRGKTK